MKGRTVDLNVDPIQVLEHLERVPFMGYAEARKGPLILYSDIFYANLGLTADGVRSRNIGTTTAALGVDFEEAVVEVGGAYEIMKCDRRTAIDILAGARYWHQDLSINLALTGTLDIDGLDLSRGIAIARGGNVDWVDPVVGGRIRYNLAPGQDFMLRGGFGGFGVGSEFSWNALAAYSFVVAAQDESRILESSGIECLTSTMSRAQAAPSTSTTCFSMGRLAGWLLAFWIAVILLGREKRRVRSSSKSLAEQRKCRLRATS